MTRVNRIDAAGLKSPMRTDSGFLKVEGRIARIGVQEYRDSTGALRRELRLPEEVFDDASLASFHQVPVTNGHPTVMLTARNARKYAVGSVGENVRRDGDYVAAPLMITDADAIAAIEQGRSQLSNGYSCELDETKDPALVEKWGHFDSVQRKIRGNHCALVDVARAGPGASLRLDAGDAVACDSNETVAWEGEDNRMPLKMKLDGFEIEVMDANTQAIIERTLAAEKSRSDEAAKKVTDVEKRLSETQARLDVADAKLKEATDLLSKSDASLEARADALSTLKAKAREVLGANVKLDGGEVQIMKLVIGKRLPKIKLDGKDDAYVRASYDSAIASLPEAPAAIDAVRGGALPPNQGPPTTTDLFDGSPSRTPEEAKARQDARYRAMLVK